MSHDHTTVLQPGQKSKTLYLKKKTFKNTDYHQLEWPLLKSQEITDAGEDMEKQEHFYTVDESVN